MYNKLKRTIVENWRRQSVILITFACILINAFTLTLYFKNEEINSTKDWVIHSYEVLRQTQIVMRSVQDMDIGQRGYLLSERPEFLKPYEAAAKDIETQSAKLRAMLTDNPEQLKRADEILADIKSHHLLLDNQIQKFKSKKYVITIHDLEQSDNLMNSIRQKANVFRLTERAILDKREKEDRKQRSNYVDTIIAGSILSVIALIIANSLIIVQSSRRKRAEGELKRSEEIYTLVTQGINEGIYEYDLDHNNIFYSKGYKKMLGYSDAEFPNNIESLNEHIHPEDFKQTWENVHSFLEGKADSYRNFFRLRHKDGHYIWVMSRGVGIKDERGKITKIIGTHTDITEQKESEEYLKQLNSDLENFTYITSHDLRSPLVNLKGFASEMQISINELKTALAEIMPKRSTKTVQTIKQVIDNDLPEALGYIKTSVERLDQLTSAILDLSRIGRRDLKVEHINTEELVKKIIEGMAYEINNKKVQVKVNKLPEVNCDLHALQQIFSNIIENAIKYLSDDREGIITIKGDIFPGETQFMIIDNGRGISEGDSARVFDMFKRARNVNEVRGMGMGMSFVKATVQRLGGKIWFESRLDQGTKFIFTIPNRMRRDAHHE